MEKIFALFVIFSCSLLAKTQVYQVFPTSSVVWVDNHHTQSSNDYCRDHQYVISKDTSFKGIQYHEIHEYVKDYTNPLSCYPFNYSLSNRLVGYFRNDSLNKKVWFRLPSDTTDRLLYDFDLKLNQAYPNTYLDSGMGSSVSKIDSVFLDNKFHKRYEISTCPTYYLIEGVGSSVGFLSSPHCFDVSTYLKCMSVGDSTVYPNSNAGCGLVTNIDDHLVGHGWFEPYPNPTTGKVSLTGFPAFKRIEIYDAQGQKVQQWGLTKESLDLPKESGLYFIRLLDREGAVFVGKVMKR